MHCSDEDLILHYYREPDGNVDGHLSACGSCRARYDALVQELGLLPLPDAAEPGPEYGRELWQRLEPRLPVRAVSPLRTLLPRLPAAGYWLPAGVGWPAAAAVVLVAVGFAGGRLWTPASEGARTATTISADDVHRVLLMSVADHLERSDRVLTDILNTSAAVDLPIAREWAEDLLATSRLYRQDAVEASEHSVAAVLDELERALLEIVHSPEDASDEDLQRLHRRLNSAALLFKVRVLSDQLRERQTPRAAGPVI